MFKIAVGSEVSLAHNVFQGAMGLPAGTRCQVLGVSQPTKPEQPIVLTLAALTDPKGLLVRALPTDTLEGLINTMQGQLNLASEDSLVFLQALDSIKEKFPEAAKSALEFALLKLSPTGKELAVHRPDKDKGVAPAPVVKP